MKSAKAKSKRCFIWYQYKTWYFATKMMDIVNESKKKLKAWKCKTEVEMEVNMVTKQVFCTDTHLLQVHFAYPNKPPTGLR